jgi:N-terminal acetyltransferase B complex catalytic subunit
VHGYDPRTNDSDNEDRKVGGVHIDGFLQPITAKQGSLGAGRTKSKSQGPSTADGKGKGKKKAKGKGKGKAEEDAGEEGEG